jgi:hypothetical protein
VDFSEARDLFVNIFQISDLTAKKIVDRGSISENLRGLSAKSGPWVDFTKVQGGGGTRLGSHRSSGGAVEAGRWWCRTGRRRRSVRSSCGLRRERLRAR